MAIKLSGEISIQDIVDEFGGIPPHGIDDYYRGGNKVSNNSYNQNIPISGAISLEDFYGARASVQFSALVYGGGGGGGNGFADGSGTGRTYQGKSSGIMSEATYNEYVDNGTIGTVNVPAEKYLASVRAPGGLGGFIANSNGTSGGVAGSGTPFGEGGAGGVVNNIGGDAPWVHWGSGGGGAGGDNGSGSYLGYNNDSPGEAGTGGTAGSNITITYELVAGIKYYVMLGAGGQNGIGGNYAGGDGNPGALLYRINSDEMPQFVGAGNNAEGIIIPEETSGTEALRIKNHVFEIVLTNSGDIQTTKVF